MKNSQIYSSAIDSPLTAPVCLDGIWDFAFTGKHPAATELAADIFSERDALTWEKALVPSAFDASLAHAGKRGIGIYRRQFGVTPGRSALLHFGAVSLWSQIYVDGVLLAQSACGYAPQEVLVPPSAKAVRTLVVLVDNRFDFERVPMHEHYFDFYQYGGILRPVTLREIAPQGVWIDAVRVTPVKDGYREGRVCVEVDLREAGGSASAVQVGYSFDGAAAEPFPLSGAQQASSVPEPSLRAPQGQAQSASGRQSKSEHGFLEQSANSQQAFAPVRTDYPVQTLRAYLRVANQRLWSPQEPNLHTLNLELRDAAGSVLLERRSVRFGLRCIEARDGALWLNGEPLVLKGYNRHEWHPNYGPCTPRAQMFADIELLKDLGCNFVRGSHYHQDQRFLDLCDELGLLVWEENLGWGQRERTFASEAFVRDHRRALLAMLRESFNHPSIIIWGFLNEAGSNEAYAREVFEQTAQDLRDLDGSRLVSYASMFPEDDLYFGLVDVISVNTYPGWYGCEDVEEPLALIAPRIDEFIRNIDARGFGDKPILISEIGAEGLYGWRDPHNDFFTETYQAAYLKESIRAALAHPRCCGIALWHFSDVRTYSGGWSLKRPRAFNNKGTLDEYRRPKEAYPVVRQAFGAQ